MPTSPVWANWPGSAGFAAAEDQRPLVPQPQALAFVDVDAVHQHVNGERDQRQAQRGPRSAGDDQVEMYA